METDNLTSCDPLPRQVPCGLPCCQQLLRDARQQVGYYKALHQRALLREAQLKEQRAQYQLALTARQQRHQAERLQRIADLEAENRLLKQRLYGRSCESHHRPNTLAHDPATDDDADAAAPPTPPPRRPRGQQCGRPGHGRRPCDRLPVSHETTAWPPEQRHCNRCGRPFAPCGSEPHPTAVSEVTVRAHRRLIRRRRYRPTCACGVHPALITAPAPPRLIPNSALGVSVWVLVLLDKYAFYRPTHRLLEQLRLQGLDLAQGTLTDGLQRLLPLLQPV